MKRFAPALVALVALLALSGCTAGGAQPAGPANVPPTPPAKTLTVFAAASLKGAFGTIAEGFAADNPGVRVAYNFNGSSALVDQLKGGAPADVFASADQATMAKATDASLVVGTPVLFATNTLTLVVAPGNPLKITGLDATLDGRKLVVCAVGVPCGNATKALAANLGVTLKPVSEEQTVTDVLGKVTSGEADAGVVYATDAAAAGARAATVRIPGAEKVVNRYPIAVTANAEEPALASAYIAYVTGPEGQAALAGFAFEAP